ncbi:MAG: tRNA threonylcarbamoyladenosine dehydratase [Ruminiclostridium sp.]|nr:tRNA threonylcarbamoyladenosine dehydratase [Ruminiclostridium sp.]
MNDIFARTRLVLGNEALERLAASRVAVFGLGGVGGYAAEALARSGIGALDIIDRDTVNPSNLNRQIIALRSTVGRYKTDVMAERIKDINPDCRVTAHRTFFLPENADSFDFSGYDFIADAVDTVTAKLEIIARARAAGKPVISCMGTGGKTDPSMLEIADIYDTAVCPLARVMRSECRKRGIDHLTVVYSKEVPVRSGLTDPESGKPVPGSTAFVPPSAGLLIAGHIVRYICGRQPVTDSE